VTLRYQCSPHRVNDAFYPIIRQLWQAAGFVGGEPAAARLDKLEAMTTRSGLEANEITPFIATLLSVPFERRYPPIEMPPSELKERTIAALIGLFEAPTHDAPVLALLEDAHWIDPSSLDVFSRLIDRLSGLRAMLVLTFRPEFTAPWLGRSEVVTLRISRFDRRQSVTMIEQVTGGKALPAEVLEQVVAKTDGVPLFVEELTKTVLESGLLRAENGAYVLASALTPLAIPSTLQDSLMARLDRLGPVKEIAQIGATIGREFSYRLLEALSPIAGLALQDALRQLMASELIHGRGAPPDATYVFKHALVQDTAYASLLRSRRQSIHAAVARVLRERFSDQVKAAPAIIADHYTKAGLAEPAVRSWLEAAELSLARSANTEADRYVDAGLAVIPRLTDGPDRQSLELSLQLARANALLPLKGQTAPETLAALTAAKRAVDAGVGTGLQRFSVLFALCLATFAAAQMGPSLALARQLVDVADRHDDPVYRLVGYRVLGMIQLYMGRNRASLESLRRADQYRDPDRRTPLIYRFATDPNLAVLCWKILALLELGFLDHAARIGEQVLAELAGHGHAPTVAMCTLFAVIWPEVHFGDLEACERHSAELIAHCTEKRVGQYRVVGAIFHTYARATREPTGANIAAYRAAIDTHHGSGARLGDTFFISMLAEALLAAGDVKGAQAALKEAFAYVEGSGEHYRFADLHRVEGQIALKQSAPDRAKAEACFLQAIESARSQEARMLELRAANDLARLWRETNSPKRSPAAAGADPRRDRRRRVREGCPERPRAARGNRLIGAVGRVRDWQLPPPQRRRSALPRLSGIWSTYCSRRSACRPPALTELAARPRYGTSLIGRVWRPAARQRRRCWSR
jgi:tetratricopeptide (TPR) repeat protein